MNKFNSAERDLLQQLFEDVRGFFRHEADPAEQDKRSKAMRATAWAYMDARENGDFDGDKNG